MNISNGVCDLFEETNVSHLQPDSTLYKGRGLERQVPIPLVVFSPLLSSVLPRHLYTTLAIAVAISLTAKTLPALGLTCGIFAR